METVAVGAGAGRRRGGGGPDHRSKGRPLFDGGGHHVRRRKGEDARRGRAVGRERGGGRHSGTGRDDGIRRVGRGAVEERGRSSQVGHAGVVGVAVHGAGDGGVTGLLWRGARDVTVRRHTTAAAHETLIALYGLRDVDRQLSGEGVDSHHACVARARELAVTSWDAVQGLRDVRRSLQDDLLVVVG